MDLGEWLRGLGLGQYETTFQENGIDAEVLPDLIDADLDKLGVLLGHRKRLLKALAGLSSTASMPPAPSTVISGPSVDAAERRQLTVMFCDLVGSTAMSRASIPRTCAGSSQPIASAARR